MRALASAEMTGPTCTSGSRALPIFILREAATMRSTSSSWISGTAATIDPARHRWPADP